MTTTPTHPHTRLMEAKRLADLIRAHGPEYEPHIEEATSGGSVYVTVSRHEMTRKGARHATKKPHPVSFKARFADHGSYWGCTISVDPLTRNSGDDALALFEHAVAPKGTPPRITAFSRSFIDPRDRVQGVVRVEYQEKLHKNGASIYWREVGQRQAVIGV